MKVKQLLYPTSTGQITLRNVTYLQIGVERPHSAPISEIEDFNVVLSINGITYTVTDKEILEFGDVYFTTLSINILDANNPYLIVDLGYRTAD